MSDKLHLVIPGAVLPATEGTLPAPLGPNLRALLAELAPAERVERTAESLSTPFELALAGLLGLPAQDGRIPWAAMETGTAGVPCAWIRLCHWRVGADHVALVPPEDLALAPADGQTLLAAMVPYFLEDGMALRAMPDMPGAWLATGEPLRALSTLSMDHASDERLTPAALDTGGPSAAILRRLQNEMQMLLYTHPVNDTRQRAGLLPVNSFWVTGAGVLDRPFMPDPHVRVEQRLVQAAQRRDPAAHAHAWDTVDADSCASLLARLRAGDEVQLTLCGPQAAQSFGPAKTSLWQRFSSVLGLLRPSTGL